MPWPLLIALPQSSPPNNTTDTQEKKEGFKLLFNGKNLDGWEGDPVRWSVKDGDIVGSSDGHPFKVNTFLIYKDKFANFILKGDIKLRNHNSGIQFRSEQLPGEGWMVRGYQADASEVGDEKSAWGNLYEERLRGRNVMKTPGRRLDRSASRSSTTATGIRMRSSPMETISASPSMAW